jgi:hypothetical protein
LHCCVLELNRIDYFDAAVFPKLCEDYEGKRAQKEGTDDVTHHAKFVTYCGGAHYGQEASRGACGCSP